MAQVQFSREVRFGLVLYGGVSLATYINGVAHEFYRAVRGLGPYSLLKEIIDADIVVDVISGTSAGGINGLMLAYVLANGKDFAPFASLWRQHGDFERLMRDPDALPDETESLLDGEGYYQEKLEQALQSIYEHEQREPEAWENHPSETSEVDLFVTATDVEGNTFTTFDDAGHAIDVKEHRTVFRLKYRKDRTNDFGPLDRGRQSQDNVRALATLARATSAFPGAFPPVHVKEVPGEDGASDGRLQRWGKLRKEAYFVDGGVLDNKPFTHTLNAIFRRLANRSVDRRLFYVEPDPERFAPRLGAARPDFLEVIVKSVAGIPSYESIASDLELLREHNNKVERYLRLARAAKLMRTRNAKIYDRARWVALCDRALEGVLREKGNHVPIKGDALLAARELASSFDSLAENAPAYLDGLDVYRRLRRAFHLSYEAPNWQAAGQTLDGINDVIQMLEIFQHWMEYVVDHADFPWHSDGKARPAAEVWGDVQTAYEYLLDNRGLSAGACGLASRADVHKALQARAAHIVKTISAGERLETPKGWGSALVGIDAHLQGLAHPKLKSSLAEFDRLDTYLYPMQVVADLHERDVVKVTRISPLDAQQGFSRRTLEEKLSGDELFHFGGFLKRSWRSNDILWGRLDALCEIFECLLSHQTQKAWTPPPLANQLDEILPSTPAKERQCLRDWLESGCPGAKEEFEENQRKLIRAAQLEILQEELCKIFIDAADQEAEWNRKRVNEVWAELPGFQDRCLESLRGVLEGDKVRQKGFDVSSYFEQSYHVGAEKFQAAVPQIVQWHLLAQAFLVVRNCLKNSLGKRGAVATVAWPVAAFNWAVRLLYRYLGLRRRSPQGLRSLELVLLPVGLAVLAVTMFSALATSRPLFSTDDGVSAWRFLLLAALPALVVVLGILRLRERWRWVGSLSVALLATAGLLAAASLFAAVGRALQPPLTNQEFGWIAVVVSAAAAFAGGWLFQRSAGVVRRSRRERRSELAKLNLLELLGLSARFRVNLRAALEATEGLRPDFIKNARSFTLKEWKECADSGQKALVQAELCQALNLEGERKYHKINRFARRRYECELDQAIDRIFEEHSMANSKVQPAETPPSLAKAASGSTSG